MKPTTYLIVTILLLASSISLWAGHVSAGFFSPDGSMLATKESDCTVAVWETESGKRIATLYEPFDFSSRPPPPCLTKSCHAVPFGFSPDGKLLATQLSGGPIILWDARNGLQVASLDDVSTGASQYYERARFSADSRFIYAVTHTSVGKMGREGRITVWNISTHKEWLNYRAGKERRINSVTFSPDGKTLMATEGPWNKPGHSDTIKLWDMEHGEELAKLKGRSAYFSPDGRFLFIGSLPFATNMLWNIRTGELRVLKKPGRAVQGKSK